MFDSLKDELIKHFIVIDDVNIRDIKFSAEYQKAIEQKQIAQQDAERMNYVLEKSRKEKEQKIIDAEAVKESKIIQAQGEAEAISKVGDALRRNPNVISYEYVQKEFGIKEGWLREMFDKMEKLGCGLLEESYIYEDIDPSSKYNPPRHEVLEFELESGGFFGPDWTKGIAYYPYSYMPKTQEDGHEGKWIFYQYFNKIEDNWYVFSRR